MFGVMGVLSGLVSLILWVLWTFGATGEFPNRVAGVAIFTLVATIALLVVAHVRGEYWTS